MKKVVSIVLCFLVLLSLTACGDEDYLNKEGIIYSKEFLDEEKTEIKNDGYDKYKYTYEKQYIIYVKYSEDFYKDYYKTYAFYVSKDTYDSVQVGDSYLYNETKDSLSPRVKSKDLIDE